MVGNAGWQILEEGGSRWEFVCKRWIGDGDLSDLKFVI
jgi:hypothetical protein